MVNNAFSIYPNPADNTVTIASLNDHFKNTFALIFTMDGRVVRKDELNAEYTVFNINNIPSGSYVIKVVDKHGKELGSETMIKK